MSKIFVESGLARLVRAGDMFRRWTPTLRAMFRILARGPCPAGACPHVYPDTSKHLPVGLSKYLLPTDQNGSLLLTLLIRPYGKQILHSQTRDSNPRSWGKRLLLGETV